jgi:hypothetical protein
VNYLFGSSGYSISGSFFSGSSVVLSILIDGRNCFGDLRLPELKSQHLPPIPLPTSKQGKLTKPQWCALELPSKSREANDLGEKRQDKNELLLSALRHLSAAIVLPERPWWSATNRTSTSAAPSRLHQHLTHQQYLY